MPDFLPEPDRETGSVRGNVARRFLALFLICALIPIGALAVVSYQQVTGHLREQSEQRLHQASKAMGMVVLGRIVDLEALLPRLSADAPGSSNDAAPPAYLRERFRAVAIGKAGAPPRTLWGRPIAPLALDRDAREHLAGLFVPQMIRLADPGVPFDEAVLSSRELLYFHVRFWPLAFVCLIGVVVSSYLIYLKMIGPLIRFVQVFHAVGQDVIPPPIGLRSTDYLVPQADALDAMLAGLRRRLEEIEADAVVVTELARELQWEEGGKPPSEIIAELTERGESLRNRVGSFLRRN